MNAVGEASAAKVLIWIVCCAWGGFGVRTGLGGPSARSAIAPGAHGAPYERLWRGAWRRLAKCRRSPVCLQVVAVLGKSAWQRYSADDGPGLFALNSLTSTSPGFRSGLWHIKQLLAWFSGGAATCAATPPQFWRLQWESG